MARIVELTGLDGPELDVYARLTEGELRRRREPEKGVFIAESPKVIERALDAGYEPLSLLAERRLLEGPAAGLLDRCGDIPAYTGPRELLTALHDRGVKVAIVSTKHGSTIRKIFDHQGLLHTADLIVGGSDVTRSKPDPEGLSFALARLELTAEQVLFCGDTVIDAQTARNGGADFSAVLNGTTPAAAFDAWPHVHVAPDLNELGRWLGVL